MEAHLIGAVVIIRAPQGFEAEGIRDSIEKLDPAEEGRALLASMNIWKDARDATPDG